tara:strand:+ start:180 stop:482 length:303 start_codon:yes stop_codon:yes gene_type:complete
MKIIEISNFHTEIGRFCSQNSLDVCDSEIIIKMIKNGYSFVNIPPSKMKRGLAELRIVSTKGNHKESLIIIMNDLKPCPYCQKIEEKEDEEDEEYNMDSE